MVDARAGTIVSDHSAVNPNGTPVDVLLGFSPVRPDLAGELHKQSTAEPWRLGAATVHVWKALTNAKEKVGLRTTKSPGAGGLRQPTVAHMQSMSTTPSVRYRYCVVRGANSGHHLEGAATAA